MDEPPSSSTQYRPRRLAIICGAALAAAVFTPIPVKAFAAAQPLRLAMSTVSTIWTTSTVHTGSAGNALAVALISTGMVGLGLAASGLVIVAMRRRRY
jgi:hypothetical protein